jgi:hypothetical protein
MYRTSAGNKMPGTSIIPLEMFGCANFNSNDCNAAFFSFFTKKPETPVM